MTTVCGEASMLIRPEWGLFVLPGNGSKNVKLIVGMALKMLQYLPEWL